MAAVNYSPGPWISEEGKVFDDTIPVMQGDNIVCAVWPMKNWEAVRDEVSRANAKLIAAAPDLLEAAKAVLCFVESEGRDTGLGGPFSDLRVAIERAL